MVYLPDQMIIVYERLKKELKLSAEVSNFTAFNEEENCLRNNYDLKFWQEILNLNPSFKVKNAYFKAYLDALALDRWKMKMEKYPAWVRRDEHVRYINNHLERIMPMAQKSLHRREAIGLALARMETFDRKVAKKSHVCWAIAGESLYLGNKDWRNRFEEILPKGATYRFCYSYSNLMVKGLGKKLLNQLFTLQPSLYISKNGLWYPQNLSGYDGLIWIGKKEDCPLTGISVVSCSPLLSTTEQKKILNDYQKLKRSIR